MRLYIKLLALILLTLAANQYAVSSVRRHAAWFTIRCAYADAVGDERMQERLVQEGAAYLHSHGQWETDDHPLVAAARPDEPAIHADDNDDDAIAPALICSAAR